MWKVRIANFLRSTHGASRHPRQRGIQSPFGQNLKVRTENPPPVPPFTFALCLPPPDPACRIQVLVLQQQQEFYFSVSITVRTGFADHLPGFDLVAL